MPCPQSCHRPCFHLACPFLHESVCFMSPSMTPTHLPLTFFHFSRLLFLLRSHSVSPLCDATPSLRLLLLLSTTMSATTKSDSLSGPSATSSLAFLGYLAHSILSHTNIFKGQKCFKLRLTRERGLTTGMICGKDTQMTNVKPKRSLRDLVCSSFFLKPRFALSLFLRLMLLSNNSEEVMLLMCTLSMTKMQ